MLAFGQRVQIQVLLVTRYMALDTSLNVNNLLFFQITEQISY